MDAFPFSFTMFLLFLEWGIWELGALRSTCCHVSGNTWTRHEWWNLLNWFSWGDGGHSWAVCPSKSLGFGNWSHIHKEQPPRLHLNPSPPFSLIFYNPNSEAEIFSTENERNFAIPPSNQPCSPFFFFSLIAKHNCRLVCFLGGGGWEDGLSLHMLQWSIDGQTIWVQRSPTWPKALTARPSVLVSVTYLRVASLASFFISLLLKFAISLAWTGPFVALHPPIPCGSPSCLLITRIFLTYCLLNATIICLRRTSLPSYLVPCLLIMATRYLILVFYFCLPFLRNIGN